MAYVTCPACLTPQQVGDEESGYRCFTCAHEIQFFACPHCGLVQTVSKRWTRFVCSRCEKDVDLPRRWGYVPGAVARRVEGAGHSWPRW